MTRISPRKSSIGLWFIIGVISLLAACGQLDELSGKREKMAQLDKNLWQLIDILAQQMPLSRAKVETVIRAPLVEKKRNEYLIHYSGGTTELKGDVKISKIDLALGPTGEFDTTSGLSMEIADTCIGIDDLRKRYDALQITQHPRGHSSEEATVHTAIQSWGSISFAFKEKNPGCLFSVTLRKPTE